MIVGGIEHLGNELRLIVLAHDFIVVALRKELHVEVLLCAGTPQAKHAHRLGIGARNHHVVGDRLDFLGIAVDGLHAVVRPALLDLTVEFDDELLVAALGEPAFAAGEPHIGKLDLPAVHDLLLEETVLIEDGKTHGGIVLRRKSVQKTGGEAAESPISEPCIGLFFIEILQRELILLFECPFDGIADAEIVDAVLEGAAHQKLHAEIIDPLCARRFHLEMELLTLFEHDISHAHDDSLVDLLPRCLGGAHAEIPGELAADQLLCFLLR